MWAPDQTDFWSGNKVYSRTQQWLQELVEITPASISSKETQSRLSNLVAQSKMSQNAAPSKARHNLGNNNVINVDNDGNTNIRIWGDGNSVTVVDSKRIGVDRPVLPVPNMELEVNRLATFNSWPHSAPVSANALARAGFYFMKVCDQVQCFACHGIIGDWEYGDTAMGEHKKHFPKCPFVRDTSYKNVPLTMDSAASGASNDHLAARRAQEKASGLHKASPKLNEPKKPQGGKRSQGRQVNSGFAENILTCEGNPTRQPTIDSAESEMRLTFRSEYKRLLSYQNWPRTNPMEPQDLAKAGFYYLEKDDIVQCFACFGKIRDWESHDTPSQEHQRHFPSCPFVLGLDVKNEPITSLQASNAVSITYRESSGFERTLEQLTKKVEAALPQTAKVMSRWEQSPSSPRVVDKPKYPDFTGENARVDTFQTPEWPGILGITPQQLARAGFFFTGEGDNAKCFYCGGGLKHWESTDEPWTEHAKWFPVCEWLLQQRGQTFVSYVVRNFPVDTSQLQGASGQSLAPGRSRTTVSAPAVVQRPSSPHVAPPIKKLCEDEAGVNFKKTQANETPLEKAMASRPTKNVLEMGFEEPLVRRVVQSRLQTAGKEFDTTDDLLEAFWKAEEQEAKKQEAGAGAAKELGEKFNEDQPEKGGKDVRTTVEAEIGGLSKLLANIEVQDPATTTARVGSTERPESPDEVIREVERLRDEKLCKVCLDNEANVVLMPCNHLVLCNSCASSLRTCPICRRTITSAVKIFKS